jgi:hypothetical protein
MGGAPAPGQSVGPGSRSSEVLHGPLDARLLLAAEARTTVAVKM